MSCEGGHTVFFISFTNGVTSDLSKGGHVVCQHPPVLCGVCVWVCSGTERWRGGHISERLELLGTKPQCGVSVQKGVWVTPEGEIAGTLGFKEVLVTLGIHLYFCPDADLIHLFILHTMPVPWRSYCLRFSRLTLTLSCPMDLKNFPMDSQMCIMQLESCEWVHLQWQGWCYGQILSHLITRHHMPFSLPPL